MRGLLIVLLLLAGVCVNAQQNLVPNGDFEENTGCPGFNSFSKLKDWYPCGTPDYFHVCAINNAYLIPTNYYGYQPTYNGNAYVGIITYWEKDIREYIAVKLTNKLSSDSLYIYTMYINVANYCKYFTPCVGVDFRYSINECVFNDPKLISVSPSIDFTNKPVIYDTLNWIKYEGIYKPNGGEEWLIIGNFKPDVLSSKMNVSGTLEFAYIYIDNVSLTVIRDTTAYKNSIISPSSITVNSDGLNDKFKILNSIILNKIKLNIYNRWGQTIYSTTNTNFEWDGTFNGTRVPLGLYVWQAEYTTIYDNRVQYATGNVTVLY